ncbi:MAG: cupin domain-containing protein [Dehalococcoidia bacterium]
MSTSTELPVVVRHAEQPQKQLGGLAFAGGAPHSGQAQLTRLARGTQSMIVHLACQKGFHSPSHQHPENETLGYVVSGLIRINDDDQEYLLGPGDSWFHAKGIRHSLEALEDSHVIEVHTPHRQDILSL